MEEEEPRSSTPLATTSAPITSGSELNGENDAMGHGSYRAILRPASAAGVLYRRWQLGCKGSHIRLNESLFLASRPA
jgi:hypothetical protein